MEITLHGTCISVGRLGVLIVGPPGSGKSSLALRLMDGPGYGISADLIRSELVSDDQVIVRQMKGGLVASAPPVLAGKFEIRGLGIVAVATTPEASLALVVSLKPHTEIERMPAPQTREILGIAIPLVEIDANSASAPARLRASLNGLMLWKGPV
jgi:HPr kinase/phosphorylase